MKREQIVEIITEELLGRLPVPTGPFTSKEDAIRIAAYHNKKRFDIAMQIADRIMDIDQQPQIGEDGINKMKAKEFLDKREFNVLVKGTLRKVTLHNTDLERLLEEYAKQSVEQPQIGEDEIKQRAKSAHIKENGYTYSQGETSWELAWIEGAKWMQQQLNNQKA